MFGPNLGLLYATTLSKGGGFDIPGLPLWSAAVREMKAGTRNARLLCIGDSTTAGHGANAAGMGSNNKAGSWPTQLAALLTTSGLYASANAMVGNNNATNTAEYDSDHVTFGAGWGFSAAAMGQTLGGYHVTATSGATNFNYASVGAVDTFEILWTKAVLSPTASLMGVAHDGGAVVASLNGQAATTGDYGFARHILSMPPAAHTLNITRQSGTVFLAGVIAYDSTRKEITVLNAGWSGSLSTDWSYAGYPWSQINAIDDYDPDLTIICLGINDANKAGPTNEATYKAAIQAVITAARTAGSDVLLAYPNGIGGTYSANLAAFRTWIAALATTNGLNAPIDFQAALGGSYAAANAAGHMRDELHPNASGYARMAAAVKARIR